MLLNFWLQLRSPGSFFLKNLCFPFRNIDLKLTSLSETLRSRNAVRRALKGQTELKRRKERLIEGFSSESGGHLVALDWGLIKPKIKACLLVCWVLIVIGRIYNTVASLGSVSHHPRGIFARFLTWVGVAWLGLSAWLLTAGLRQVWCYSDKGRDRRKQSGRIRTCCLLNLESFWTLKIGFSLKIRTVEINWGDRKLEILRLFNKRLILAKTFFAVLALLIGLIFLSEFGSKARLLIGGRGGDLGSRVGGLRL